jgi:hypothetical protein
MHLPSYKKKRKPVCCRACGKWIFWKLFRKYNSTLQAGVAFENFPTTHENFPKHVGACMPTRTQKTKNQSLLDGRRLTVAIGLLHALPRCDPGEHMLPIIQRLRWYAQLAGWLANPRRG